MGVTNNVHTNVYKCLFSPQNSKHTLNMFVLLALGVDTLRDLYTTKEPVAVATDVVLVDLDIKQRILARK